MATINLSNASCLDVTRQILWTLYVDHSNDRIEDNSTPIYFVGQLVDKPELFINLHTSINSGVADPQTKILTQTENILKFQTTAFSDAAKDRDITMQISGQNLLKNNASTKVNQITLNFKGTEYQNGQPKVVGNISEIQSDITTWAVSYSPSLITNQVADDGLITFTSLTSTNGKSEKYYSDGQGNKVTENQTYQEGMQGTFMINETGMIDGLLKKLSTNTASTQSNGITSKHSLTISSMSGLRFDQDQTLEGSLLIKTSHEYKDGSYNQLVTFADTQENATFANALTDFIDNKNQVNDLTAALLNKDDKITGKAGNNTINGYAGNDTLTGGAGNDYFQFTTTLNSLTNVDKISGFKKSGVDKIQLSKEIFIGYLGSDNFLTLGARVMDADDRILYEKQSGKLFYDADGNGNATAIQFATLVGKPTISSADIELF